MSDHKKDDLVSVRISKELKSKIQDEADKLNISISAYVYSALMAEYGHEFKRYKIGLKALELKASGDLKGCEV